MELGEDEEPIFPFAVERLFRIYAELNDARPSGFGFSPLSYTEVHAYTQLMKVQLSPWDIKVLKMIDSMQLHAVRIKSERASENGRHGKRK